MGAAEWDVSVRPPRRRGGGRGGREGERGGLWASEVETALCGGIAEEGGRAGGGGGGDGVVCFHDLS